MDTSTFSAAVAEARPAIVDLAERLSQPVALADSSFRPLAHSPHYGLLDVSRARLMQGTAPSEHVRRHLLSHGIARPSARVVIPPIHDLELGRVCLPISDRDEVLGYVWLIDATQQLTSGDLDAVRSVADRIVEPLRKLRNGQQSRTEPSLLLRLLSTEPRTVRSAVEDAADRGLPASGWVVVAIRQGPGQDGPPRWAEARSAALSTALPREFRELERRVPGVRMLDIERDPRDDGWVAAVAGADGLDRTLGRQGERIALRIRRDHGWVDSLRVGIGARVESLGLLCDSYRTARLAVDVGARLAPSGAVTIWGDLGAYRALAGLLGDQVGLTDLADEIARLRASRSGDGLVRTLETYLDLAGNAAAASERLFIHRATLYQRLARVEELLGRDLADGTVRTSLHLAVKAWRLRQEDGLSV